MNKLTILRTNPFAVQMYNALAIACMVFLFKASAGVFVHYVDGTSNASVVDVYHSDPA